MKYILGVTMFIVCSVATSNLLRADDLQKPLLGSLHGAFFQPGTDAHGNAITVIKPITKRLLLNFFGYQGVSTSDAHYFLDYDNNTFVLAKDNNTIYGTLIGGIATNTFWPTRNNATAYGFAMTSMNGALSGTEYEVSGPTRINGHFIASGKLNTVPTVMSCTFSFKIQP